MRYRDRRFERARAYIREYGGRSGGKRWRKDPEGVMPHTAATEVMCSSVARAYPEIPAKLRELEAATPGDVVDVFGVSYRCNGASPWQGTSDGRAMPTFEPVAEAPSKDEDELQAEQPGA